jgi:hypothetical protein
MTSHDSPIRVRALARLVLAALTLVVIPAPPCAAAVPSSRPPQEPIARNEGPQPRATPLEPGVPLEGMLVGVAAHAFDVRLEAGRARPGEPAGLVGRWSGDGDASDAVGTNDGAWMGTETYGPGVRGLAFVFDGASAVEMGTAGLPSGGGDRTLALWVRIDAKPVEEAFFAGYGRFGAINQTYHLGADVGDLVCFSQWGDGMTGPRLRLGAWYHVVATR